MTTVTSESSPSASPKDLPSRVLGHVKGAHPGPCVVCLASIHGNEPSGYRACQRVLEVFQEAGSDLPQALHGDLVCIVGNVRALAAHERFLDFDLNRAWTARRVHRLQHEVADERDDAPVEDVEQLELLNAISSAFDSARGPVFFIDLHTTSAESMPFVLIGDTLRNRKFAQHFPVPVILGLEEQLDGAITEWVNALGHVTVGFESGQHDDPRSIDLHESGIWTALVAAEAMEPGAIPEFRNHISRLADAASEAPRFLEVRYRHAVGALDGFAMNDGLRNLTRVQVGDTIAHDQRGPIRALESGRILMPRYQGAGDDGFFLARDIRPAWLVVSAILRYLRLDRLAPLFPGVKPHPDREHTLLVNPTVARWFVGEIFHLLGYRRRRSENGKIVVSRREFDF